MANQQQCDCHPALQTVTHCCNCQRLISWPRWVRTEHMHYDSLCWPCYAALDVTFTVANVLAQAAAIVRGSTVTR